MNELKKDLSLNDIAEKVVDAILEEKILSKESLIQRIRPILKIWIKCANEPKITSNKVLPKHIKTIENRRITAEFWRDKYKMLVSKEELHKSYDEINEILIQFDKKYV